MKRPAFQFYPADWRNDPALKLCSLAARGLWIELICIAHEGDRYGHLSNNGRALNPAQLARLVGESASTVTKLLTELEDAGVFSRDAEGCIFSRRMVKDEHLRNVRADAGRLGGNPNLLNQKDNQKVNQTVKQTPTPSSSSSSSSSSSASTLNTSDASHQYPSAPPNGHLNGQIPGIEIPATPPSGPPDCPHQKIIDLWAQLMPELQQPMRWSAARATALRSRWREEAVEHKWASEEDGLRFFAKLFRWCRKSQFLMGNAPSRNPGQAPFSLTLPWLMKAENCAKVQEGNFHSSES